MSSQIIFAVKYIKYRLFAKHQKGHSIHSPFVFDLVINVFNDRKKNQDLNKIQEVNRTYRFSREIIKYQEIGAGSSYKTTKETTVGQIVKRSSISPKYGILIYNLIRYFKPTKILELGTSVGISTAYIAQAAPDSKFISIEGIAEKTQIAKTIANKLNQHTKFIHGDFDTVINSVLENFDQVDFVFFDGNHKKCSTLKYFETCLEKAQNESIFIFDDIHWSTEMEEAWEIIKDHNKVKVSIDLFRMGLIFFRKEMSKEHYVIKF